MPLLEENLVIRFLFVFLLSVLLIKIWKLIAWNIQLVDKPNARKIHTSAVPLVGGIVVYLSIFVTALIVGRNSIELYCYLAAAGALVITGAFDDKYDISAKLRLFIEFVAAGLMIFGAGIYVDNLGNLFGLGDVVLPAFVAVPFTILAVAGYINAVNMADGLDGMAASLGIMTIVTLMILVNGKQAFAIPSVTLAAALMGFLVYNLQIVRGLRKVFMGDAGSMLLGFTFVWLVIDFSQSHGTSTALFSPVTALFVLGLPLVDMLATLARRIKKGQNPMKPDKTHVHHILLHAGYTPRQTLAIIIIIGALFHALGMVLHFTGASDLVQLIAFIVVCGLYYEAVLHAFSVSRIIQNFRGKREPARKGKQYTQHGHSKKKFAEHGTAEHLTHQPK
ncbi:hypothetical protein NX722_11235 [Endozoicomonas gorgoniicola]|uniref:Undecaprenyl-phosphate alpha-N-acetylglucosaminyl 1-phosphate transferase n=1 Tax=Endozoicomonas gorgoniicola TaxID=1234144 RepID=A0ABT3MUZ3_9GAMM|nr:hypothetical protein [Endozoicomonas gorgoniicola]MCW7553201.1 hypothetical protein [Endozoicomonas gorgoniicola]